MKHIEKNYWLLLPVVGILCIIIPEIIVKWLPTVLGSIMALTGITDTVFVIREKRYLVTYNNKASALILFIMGICFILGQESTVPLMGITWGLLGLQEVNEEIADILIKRSKKEKYLLLSVFAGLKLVLSLALLFEPIEKFSFHIFLLGLEILAVTIKEKNVNEYVEAFRKKFKK
ncbi:MAG: hypothetical protein SOW08_09495 [Lachnospiraceae bacterium]|nr:hypothetical protein [Lachnospiraceae bacterium]